MPGIIDIHSHAFPDEIAPKAIKHINSLAPDIKAHTDGTVTGLLQAMDAAGVEKSVICSIATKPKQFDSILQWSKLIRSDRIIPFLSVHPDDDKCAERLSIVKSEGFKGIKLHPYYQQFNIDEERMMRIYEKLCAENLIVVMHSGYDFAFERIKRAEPQRILNVIEKFPDLKIVTAHLGGWEEWDSVYELLVGKKIYMEISFSLEYMPAEQAKKIISDHTKGHVLYGSDSPWSNQTKTIALLKALHLPEETEESILHKNAEKLLHI